MRYKTCYFYIEIDDLKTKNRDRMVKPCFISTRRVPQASSS